MNFRRTLAASVLLLAVASGGCRREGTTPARTAPSPAPSTAAGIPEDGGTIIRRLAGDVSTLNPLYVTTDYEKQVLSYLHDALVDLDVSANVAPGIAKAWEVSPDAKVYRFDIDPAATFSDDSKITPDDVLFTIQKIADPASESVLAGLFTSLDLKETKVIDADTVQVAFTEGRASQLVNFNIPILSKKAYGTGRLREDHEGPAIGSGAYTVVSHSRGQELVLQRRARYWRARPHLDRVVFKVLGDEKVAWNALKRGDIDESVVSSDQWQFEGSSPAVKAKMEIHRFYGLAYNFIPWNEHDPLFVDRNVRRALSLCLDRGAIIKNLYHGTARVISGPFTPDQWAYNPDVPPVEYDLVEARRLLAGAGWLDSNHDGVLDKGGKPFRFEMLITAGNASSEQVVQIFQASLKEAGVVMDIAKVDTATFFDRVPSGKYQAAHLGWNLDLDPDPSSYFHSSQTAPNGYNFVFYSNPAADALMDAGRTTLDPDERQKIYRQLHEVLAADQPYTWTVQVSTKWGVSSRVKGVREGKGLGLFYWSPGPLEWWIPRAERREPASPPAQP